MIINTIKFHKNMILNKIDPDFIKPFNIRFFNATVELLPLYIISILITIILLKILRFEFNKLNHLKYVLFLLFILIICILVKANDYSGCEKISPILGSIFMNGYILILFFKLKLNFKNVTFTLFTFILNCILTNFIFEKI